MIGKDDRFNDVRMRDMLNPVYKNVMRKQNPVEIVFKDISKFDTQNPITFTLLSKISSGKLTDESVKKLLNKAPNIKDIESNQKLKSLKLFNKNFLDDCDNGSNCRLPPPLSTIPSPPPPPLPSPPFLHASSGFNAFFL